MKKQIHTFEYAEQICTSLQKGCLLTTVLNNKVNTMTIGWGTIGIEWNKPMFIAYVRESRYTRTILEQTGEFTVNVGLADDNSEALRYCGTKSGRDTDKIKDLKFSLVESEFVSAPGIKEFPITLECKVLYSQMQDLNMLPNSVLKRFYPLENDGTSRDRHIAYYGEIVNAYLIED